MSKSNKELAVEITLAVINANQRQVYKRTASVDDVTPALGIDPIINVLKSTHDVLESFDNKSQQDNN